MPGLAERPAAHRQALHAAGVVLANHGEIAAACAQWQQCIAIGRTLPADDLGTQGTALSRLSSHLADRAAAAAALAEAVAFFRATRDRRGLAHTDEFQGRARLMAGDVTGA